MEGVRQHLQPLLDAKAAELTAFAALAQTAFRSGKVPDTADVPREVSRCGQDPCRIQ
jgi:hypothetical protein